jgi:two-component system sensor kinase FixL
MSWVTVIWSMNAAACLTLAAIYLLVWQHARNTWGHLFFAFSAVGAAAVAACELLLLRTDSVEFYGTVLWWAQVPLWLLLVSVVSFTRLHLRAGRPWLAWATVGTRTLTLALNFFATPNINFSAITGLQQFSFLGETVAIAEGTLHPWNIVAKASSLLVLIFLVDASREMWRRGERSRALYLGGSMIFFITAAAVHAALVERGLVQSPYLVSFAYFGIIMAMAYESSRDVLRSAELVRELKAREVALRESEERMMLAAESASLGTWIHDLIRHEIWASDPWRALFGFTRTERIDFDAFLQRLHPEDRDAVGVALATPTAREVTYDREYRLVLPDGQIRWIGSRGRVEFASDGKPLRRRGASLDITARKQAELEAELHRSEVAHLSRVTTLGEISGSLAHELNQPLGAILANAEAAALDLRKETPDLGELRAILEDIRQDSLRAADIIQGVRAFLRRQDLNVQPHAVAELVGEVVRLIRTDAMARQVTVVLDIAPELPPVAADRIHLQQVLVNLLVNGMDAMSTNAVADRRITIRAACPDPRAVEISIVDSGVGIPPADLQRVFDSFHTTKPSGLGLGLSICRSIVEAHGGSIALRNNPDRGLTAVVRLTACLANEASGQSAMAPPLLPNA